MAADQTKISRIEFYQALASLWTFVALGFGIHLHASAGYDAAALFVVALLMAFVYSFLSLKLWLRQINAPAAA